jgi:hypothetical protein
MLAWLLYGAGMALIALGVVLSIWRRRLYANGFIALGNTAFVDYHLMKDSLGFAAFHLALALATLVVWVVLALREDA